jgi:predicted P-loop ATPase
MDDEMGGKSKQDEKRFKELTSKKIFSLRAPYAAYNEDFKRLAVLCGTSNDRNVINDPTGNTRILPVNVISIDHEAYNDINKDELFMELVRVYESGYEWQLNKAENEWLGEVSGNFEAIPYERELISQFFKAASVGGGYIEHLTSTEIKDFIEKSTVQRISNKLKFGQELRNILGDSKITSRNGSNARCYSVIRVSGHGNTETSKEDLPF